MFDNRFFISLFLLSFSLALFAQPMVSLDGGEMPFAQEGEDYRDSPKSEFVNSFELLKPVNSDSLLAKEADAVMSHENYLTALLQDQFFLSHGLNGPAFYDYLTPYLRELKKNHGHDPFYFESYYHPEVQYLTGCNMGRAGMPIVEKILFEDGRVKANLHCRTEHAEIYYSTDGSLPTKSSHQFTDIIDVPNGVTIRAIAIRDDIEVSPVIVFDQNTSRKIAVKEQLDEDKIMGIYPIPDSDEVLVKYKTKAAGEIAITLIDMHRKALHIDFVQASNPKMDHCRVNTKRVPTGSYLIKFKFESGKTTYRQVVKE